MPYRSTKTYGHNLGLSACFRQHRAQSHCKFIHGYSLEIRIEFGAETLDERGWVVDFGSLKGLKKRLEDTFDHKLLVAEDDPMREVLLALENDGLADVAIVPGTGCEAFAKMVCDMATEHLQDIKQDLRCWVYSVEVREHGANSAIYINPIAPKA